MAEGLHISLQTPISRFQQTATGWHLSNTSGQSLGTFNQLLVTLPAPQAINLVTASSLGEHLRQHIRSLLGEARYNPLISVMLGYQRQPQERPYYALVNTDKAHPISWLAWEHEKAPERVPQNSGLLIAQMAPHYTRDNAQTPDEQLISDVARLVADPSMMTARVITTILRLRRPRQPYIVVMTLAVHGEGWGAHQTPSSIPACLCYNLRI